MTAAEEKPGTPSMGCEAPPGQGVVPMRLHHIGVAVRNLDAALGYYTGLFGFRQLSEPVEVACEKVRVCFVEDSSGVRIELVEGLEAGSPVDQVLERPGAGVYHLCYQVPDLDGAIRKLRMNRCFLIKRFEIEAYGQRRFAFLLTPDRQLFELAEQEVAAEISEVDAESEASPYTFRTLFFEATRLCNLSCPMCMASSDNKGLVRRSVKRQLTTDEIEDRILATAAEIGVETIAWSGGEFLLRPDAVELVRRATRYGYSSTICTNSLKTDESQLSELLAASGGSLVVAVGINSIEDENAWTRDADSDQALRVLELCSRLGIRRHAVVNVGTHNLETLDRTLQWLEDQNIPYNRSPYTARGSGQKFWDELRIHRGDMETTIHPELRKHALGYISYTPFFLSPELHDRYSGGQRNVTVPQNPSIGCWCGTWLAVSAEGDLSPCGILLDEVQCGNVRDKSLQQLIDDSPAFQRVLNRELLQGKCGRCRYKFTCGGCRAMAYFEHGDLMAEDPTCFFEPEDETTVSEHEEETGRIFKRYAFMARHADRAADRAAQRAAEQGPLQPPKEAF